MASLEDVSFESFEAFIMHTIPETGADPRGRMHDYISQQLMKLKKMAEAFKIDLSFFQNGKRYIVTPGAAALFRKLLTLYDEPYGRGLRRGNFKAAPTSQLVRVRACLWDALVDAEVPLPLRQEQIRRFDSATGCPHRVLFGGISAPVEESIALYRAENPGADPDWDAIAEIVEFDYCQNIKPLLMERLRESIAEAIGAKERVERALEKTKQTGGNAAESQEGTAPPHSPEP